MINLTTRCYEPELLDGADIPFADIRQNMKELNTINTYLGGHKISTHGIKEILKTFSATQPVTICEIGCGGGDNLKAIESWCVKNGTTANFIGIDIKKECTAFARQQYPTLNAHWIACDYKDVKFEDTKPHIIFSSLFCHHFLNEDIIQMLQWMKTNAIRGFFINDLHRHPLAYRSIKIITALFSRSYLVKNDAPLSVARGFTKKEWLAIVAAAGLPGCTIEWKWAFRHLIIYTM